MNELGSYPAVDYILQNLDDLYCAYKNFTGQHV